MSEEHGVEPGQLIAGRYRLLTEVGKGGMGSVWRAAVEGGAPSSAPPSAPQSGAQPQEVALKIVLPKRLEGTPEKRDLALGRFSREARALMRLKSPHVVTIHDHGSDGEIVYIAMELLRGESLASRLKRVTKLDVAETVRLFNHLCRAIGLAHASGIVHRDLKPGNIFLARQAASSEDVAKVLDFGLVKSVGTPLATLDVHTRTGSLLGTPYYMSPEQARARPDVDHRADLWSLGIIAFECLCGVKPFRGKVLAKVFAQIASGNPPVPSETAEVPAGFDAWFARAVALEPSSRFQTAEAMMSELREVLVDAAISTRNARKRRLEAEVTGASLAIEGGMLHTAPIGGGRDPLPLVGREEEFDTIEEKLAAGARILTLAGPPGVGKTRLAREVARRWRDEKSLPSVACWLDEAAGPPWCWVELASGLDMDGTGEPAHRNIPRALRGLGRAVLLLDAVDGSRDALAAALPNWLAAAPEFVVLTTAREPLGVEGEVVVPIRPLPPPTDRPAGLRELMQHPTAALFLVRAFQRDRGLILQDARAGEFAQFIRRFGGVPLGLHVGAGLLAHHPLDELTASLAEAADRPDAGGTSNVAPLQAVIGWLWQHLAFAERSVLAQLSVFHDGFTLDAVEVVVDGAWRVVRRPYEVVMDLAERGLLLQEEPLVGESRYRMPRALAEFAAQVLAEPTSELDPEARYVHERHASFFASVGAPAALDPLVERGGLVRRARLSLEACNLRAALGWAEVHGDASTVHALATALATLFRCERLHAEAASVLDLASGREGFSPTERISLELARGRAHRSARRLDLAWSAFERARSVAAESRDAGAESIAWSELGLTALAAGNAHDAHRAGATGMELAGDALRPRGLAMRLLGALSLELGRFAEAQAALEHAIHLHQAVGERILEAEAVALWGELEAEVGNDERALQLFEAAHTLFGQIGSRVEQTKVLAWIGELQSRREPTTANRTLERAAARARELGCANTEAFHLALWALSLLERGDPHRAVRGVRRAEELLQGADSVEGHVAVYLCRAWLELAAQNRPALLAELHHAEHFAQVARVRPASRLGRALARLRSASGEWPRASHAKT